MGLLDKVKVQAAQAAQKAQEAGKTGQTKLESAQAKRKVDALFRDLGAAVYAQRTGKDGDPALVDATVEKIKALEAEHGDAAVATEATAQKNEAATGTEGGNYNLDEL